jgi:hypothetical protein
MDKKIIYKTGNRTFVLLDKSIKDVDLYTRIDFLTESYSGFVMLGENLLLGSILNHNPYLEYVEKELEEDREKVEELLSRVDDEHDYLEKD